MRKRCCCLYGTRQAARWQCEKEKGIKAAGMVMGKMHGDDILLAGPRSVVDAVRKSERKRHETREQMMGARPIDASEIVMLNRRAQWTEEGIRISLDSRHVKDIIDELGLKGHICRHLE